MHKQIFKVVRPKLYFSDISPPARSCLMGCLAMKIDIDLIPIDLFKSEQLKEDFVKMNIFHTVPVLEHNDLILTDSHAILFHMASVLASKNSSFHLGEDKIMQSKVLNRLFFNACVLFRRNSELMNEIFHRPKLDWEFHQLKITEAYSYMEHYLKDSKFIASDKMTIADLSTVATTSTLDMIFPISDKWKNLYDWFQIMKSLPYYKAGNEDGLNHLKQKIIQHGCIKF